MTRRLLALGIVGCVLAQPVGLRGSEDPFTALAVTQLAQAVGPREFTVPAPGGSVSLQDYRGHVVLLNFWATWCPPCREEMPAMEHLYRRYRAKGLVVLALSVDTDGESSVTPFVKQRRFTFPVGLDSEMRVASLYAIRALPSTFLLDRHGRILASAVGPREWDSLDAFALIERLLAEP